MYLWYFFSLDLSLFRFWDFLLLLLLLIRREAPRERERQRDKERENSIFRNFFFPRGRRRLSRDQKMKDFFCFYKREERLMRTQRERENRVRENKRVTFFNRERERERGRSRERERERVCLVRARSSIFFSVVCFDEAAARAFFECLGFCFLNPKQLFEREGAFFRQGERATLLSRYRIV